VFVCAANVTEFRVRSHKSLLKSRVISHNLVIILTASQNTQSMWFNPAHLFHQIFMPVYQLMIKRSLSWKMFWQSHECVTYNTEIRFRKSVERIYLRLLRSCVLTSFQQSPVTTGEGFSSSAVPLPPPSASTLGLCISGRVPAITDWGGSA
jgi:hypothetical protein